MMYETARLIALHALVVILTSRGALAAPPTDAELRAAVDGIAQESLEKPGAVGLSIAIARAGQVVVEAGYGLAEVEHRVPADGQTTFRIGSITKQFTAAAIMRLVEDGKIDLDAPFSDYYPHFPNPDDKITVRHLLTHTSGIKSYTEVREFWDEGVSRELTPAQLLDYVRDAPPAFEPGAQWAYNNTAYYLLGPIIEEAAGMSYADYLQQTFFDPLELTRTRHDSNTDVIPNRAQGYLFDDVELHNDRLIGMANPGAAGALIASAGDLVRWSIALHSGHVVNDDSYEQMITPFILTDGSSTGYGFGLGIGDAHGRPAIQHGGGIFGFNSQLTYLVEADLHVAVISNSMTRSGAVAAEIIREAMADAE